MASDSYHPKRPFGETLAAASFGFSAVCVAAAFLAPAPAAGLLSIIGMGTFILGTVAAAIIDLRECRSSCNPATPPPSAAAPCECEAFYGHSPEQQPPETYWAELVAAQSARHTDITR